MNALFKEYYLTQSPFSDPENYIDLYDTLPKNISALCAHTHNLFLHYADLNLFQVSVSDNRYTELNLRYMSSVLEKIISFDSRALSVERSAENRVMGVCRDTSLLLCSILRSRGIPARLRSGFVNYFIPGLFLDGFCVEYYHVNEERWCSVDTRTMRIHIDHYQLKIDFDLTDVPSTKFISAADAWRMCRFENADPVRFGSRQHRGLFTIRNRLIQDLALLNKQEILIWDLWGPMLSSSVSDFSLLDELSDILKYHINDINQVTRFYETHSILKIPNTLLVDNPFLEPEWVTVC